MERLRCCICGKFMKFENAESTVFKEKIMINHVYSYCGIEDVRTYHLECERKRLDKKNDNLRHQFDKIWHDSTKYPIQPISKNADLGKPDYSKLDYGRHIIIIKK